MGRPAGGTRLPELPLRRCLRGLGAGARQPAVELRHVGVPVGVDGILPPDLA
jgi:hypothetical protein